MEFITNYLLFFAKIITILIAFIIITSSIFARKIKNQNFKSGTLTIKDLNKKYKANRMLLLKNIITNKKELKKIIGEQKTIKKNKNNHCKTVFVIDYKGDIKASATKKLSVILNNIFYLSKSGDEIIVKLESSGGMVHEYGFAASQLQRVKEHNLHLTVCVDKVAASGGYLMAATADNIVAAEFSVIGSIGVLMQLPNFNKLLKKNDIEFEQFTAGQYKRTVTLFGENTKEAKEKVKQEITEVHDIFKNFVKERRAEINLKEVATGEIWYGKKAKELKLVDNIMTSDDYILTKIMNNNHVLEISIQEKQTLINKLGFNSKILDNLIDKVITRINELKLIK